MAATLERLDCGEQIRRYAPEPALDIPVPPRSAEYYAREIELILEARDHYAPQTERDWIDEHPRLALGVACAGFLLALWCGCRKSK